MKKIILTILILVFTFSVFSCVKSPKIDADSFEFSLTFGINGTSSYDSKTGELIRTKHSQNPEKYTAQLKLSEEKIDEIIAVIDELDILSYPDKYSPSKTSFVDASGETIMVSQTPCEMIILSVETAEFSKTVTCDIVLFEHEGCDDKAQHFLDAVDAITKIITETDEWKAFPELDFGFI